MRIIVTGGAGFIGSHLVDALIASDHEVIIIDNLLAGNIENINSQARFVNKDIIKDKIVSEFEESDIVFHLAADPDVRKSAENPGASFDLNVIATFTVLENCRKSSVKRFVFASTSTVYGDAKKIPTPENYPCEPISNYGASKLACEAYISSYAYTYGIKGTVLRFANIFGPRSTHGIIYDFYNKLKRNQNEMEVLGDGKQKKSYLYIDDCISAMLITSKKQKEVFNIFNVGSKETRTANEIAKLMCKILKLTPKFTYTGTPEGWKGDVTKMLLDTKKLRKLNWEEGVRFEDGVKKYLVWLSL